MPGCSAVGVGTLELQITQASIDTVPIFNMAAPRGVPAEFGFDVAGIIVHIYGNARTGGDYGLSAKTADILEKGGIFSTAVTLWGDPTAADHASERGECARSDPEEKQTERREWEEHLKEAIETRERQKAEGRPITPFPEEAEEGHYRFNCPARALNKAALTLPTACTGSPLLATMSADSWEEPERLVRASAESPAVTGCEEVNFSPSLSVHPVEPEVAGGESPTGLEVDLKLPQEESVTSLAESDVKEAEVSLPAGVTVSPSGANGLGACSEAQIGLDNASVPSCSDDSKLGTVEIITPLLETPLKGFVYVAQQGNLAGNGSNPFGSLFALYLVAEGSGALVKLPGEVRLDPVTGQISARFGKDPTTGFYLPQLPFNELKMRLYGGPRAALMTPASCGAFTTSSVLTPWDGNPAAEPSSVFAVGAGCGAQGFSPGFTGGTANNQAGEHSPFSVTLSRDDGEQRLSDVSVTTPPGLLGTLSSVAQCGEPQASRGECSQASEIGETTVAVGPGADPYWVHGGKVFLTGPYNNGPFGLSIVVPTTAGPFTLTGNGGPGREIVRASIRVNPNTGQITVVSDPFPSMLEGVPLDVRTVNINIDRPAFMFNPTNCSPLAVTGTIGSAMGASAGVSSPFQAANCAALAFKPTLSASTQGHASKADGASLLVKVTSGSGQANIGKVDLRLPLQLPSRLGTLQKACRLAQFEANPAGCPEGSVIGTAIAHTPILNVPLTGPAYLVSHGGAAFPDVEFVLQGEGVKIVLDGQTEIKNDITYSRFETVLDAPISSFETILPQGPHSILGAYVPSSAQYSLCGQKLLMPTTITGQNGAVLTQTTNIAVTGCPKTKNGTLTRSQKLASALKACRRQDKNKAKRQACEGTARRRYGPLTKRRVKKRA